METTSGTPHLLTDVRFSVARKGYDPDEVDNFLERVSAAVAQLQEKLRQATANAEAAEGRAAEATRAQTLLQARVDKLESDLAAAREQAAAAPAAPARSSEDDTAEVSKVLVLAQRTADAAVAEARATASQIVNQAEQEATRVLANARTEADENAARRRAVLAEEVSTLESDRDSLNGEISALNRYLEDQRASLGGALSRIQAVLDDPSALRLAPPPATSARSEPAGAGTPSGEAASSARAAEPGAEEAIDVTDQAEAASDHPEPAADDTAELRPATSSASSNGTSTPAPVGAPKAEATGSEAESLFEAGDASGQPGAATPVAVFDAEAPPREPAFFGKDDDEADAAMRAFFEADFDDEKRFGR